MVYRIFLITIITVSSLQAAQPRNRKSQTYQRQDNQTARALFSEHTTNEQLIGPYIKPNLTDSVIIKSVDEESLLPISHRTYNDMLHATRISIDGIKTRAFWTNQQFDTDQEQKLTALYNYLLISFNIQIQKHKHITTRTSMYHIQWIANRLTVDLPREICHKIASYAYATTDDTMYTIPKIDALLMLRCLAANSDYLINNKEFYHIHSIRNKHEITNYNAHDYKSHWELPPEIDALW